MSGRIRTIKPELLEDAVAAGLSDTAFRLFVATFLLADDYGNLRLEPAWLRAQVFWATDRKLDEVVSALAELRTLIVPYEVGGQRYGSIRNWAKHQRVSHPGAPRVPGPSENLPRLSGEAPETLVPDLRSPIPISDPDLRSPTSARGDGPVEEVTSVRVRPDPSAPAPDWWESVLATLSMQTGENIAAGEAWLRYAGHRAGKGIQATREDAMYWLTTVMVPQARKDRNDAARQRERDAKFDRKLSGGPGSDTTPIVDSPEEQAARAARIEQRTRERKARERGVA